MAFKGIVCHKLYILLGGKKKRKEKKKPSTAMKISSMYRIVAMACTSILDR
jgi:hypothetical protein